MDWTYPPNSFDFIHSRALNGCVNNWPTLSDSAYTALAPGGWFESVETTVGLFSDDGSLPEDSILHEWTTLGKKAAKMAGRPMDLPGKMLRHLQDAGFVNLKEEIYKVPLGPWPKNPRQKEVAMYNLLNLLQAAEVFTMALFSRVLGWESKKIVEFLERVKREFKNKNIHSYYNM